MFWQKLALGNVSRQYIEKVPTYIIYSYLNLRTDFEQNRFISVTVGRRPVAELCGY